MWSRPARPSSLSLPFHNSRARGCVAARGGKIHGSAIDVWVLLRGTARKRLACGGVPPRWLGPESSQCVSAKAELQAHVSFRWEPKQGYTTEALFSSLLFLHQRMRPPGYAGYKARSSLIASPCP